MNLKKSRYEDEVYGGKGRGDMIYNYIIIQGHKNYITIKKNEGINLAWNSKVQCIIKAERSWTQKSQAVGHS